jgi:hypothetical protein
MKTIIQKEYVHNIKLIKKLVVLHFPTNNILFFGP